MTEPKKRELLAMAKITYKFQITIPKRVREKFKLKEGDVILFINEDGKLVLKKGAEI